MTAPLTFVARKCDFCHGNPSIVMHSQYIPNELTSQLRYGILPVGNDTRGTAMDARQGRGLQIAPVSKVQKNDAGWWMPSQSGKGNYVVVMDKATPFCTCPDFQERQLPCSWVA